MRPRFRIRRLLQFRLGTLLLLVTVFCVALAFRQRYIVPYQRQASAVAQLLKRGGKAEYRPASPAWLGAVVGKEIYQDLVMLHVENRGLTDDALVWLYDTPHLERLYLAGNPLTDDGLRPLAGLRHLQRLSLWQTNITGDGLRHVQPLAELAALGLHSTRIRDADLEHLLPLRGLRELKLPVGITDDGLRTVGKLPELTWLGLSRTLGTRFPGQRLETAVATLTKQLPRSRGGGRESFSADDSPYGWFVGRKRLPTPCTSLNPAHRA